MRLMLHLGRRTLVVATLISLGLSTGARSQAALVGVVIGRVTDAKTGAALGYTNVAVEATSRGAIADASGHFVISALPAGSYSLVFSRVGHATLRRTDVVVFAGDTTRVDVALEQALIEANAVVVTAARAEQTTRMAPASVSVVSEEEIAAKAPATFDQAIETVPGLNAYRSTGGISVQSIQIRGSSDVAGGGVGNRVLLLIDGRPALTSDSGGAFWSLVPVAFIDHIEVVKGAFSSLYGSTAMGGVVNVITRRPGPVATGKLEMKLGFFEEPGSLAYTNETPLQNELNADYSGKVGGTSFLVSASRKHSDGYAENAAYTFYDAYGKLLWNLGESRTLELTLGGGQAKNDYPHAWLSADQPLEVRDSYADDYQEKKYGNVDLWYWGFSSEDIKYSLRAYYYHHEQLTFFNEDDPNEEIPGNEPYGFSTTIDGDKIGNLLQVEARLGARNHVVVGTDYQLDHVESSPDTILYGDHQINNYAVFVQDDVTLARSLTATVGARYDWNRLVGVRTLEQLSPKFALVWTATPELSLRALYGQAFRAPTIAEMFTEREIGGGIDIVPNPDLVAERLTMSAEVGVRWSPRDAFNLDVAAYRYQYKDLMYFADVSAEVGVPFAYQVQNLNSALMEGIETTLQSHWRALSAFANYSYLYARDESPGRTDDLLAYRPEHTAAVGADVSWKRWTVHGDARYRSQIDEVFLYPLEAPAAFWVFNGGAQYQLARAWMFSLKVNNVLDASYEEFARYRMPGRNWMFGVAMHL